jgi:catalase
MSEISSTAYLRLAARERRRAPLFQPGSKADLLIRFSNMAGERDTPSPWRAPRGFSITLQWHFWTQSPSAHQ